MSNRFKKSLEDLESKSESPPIVEQHTDESNINGSNILSNILDNITVKETQGKSVALYLSADIDETITKLAKQKGLSKSKLVDNILRQVLF